MNKTKLMGIKYFACLLLLCCTTMIASAGNNSLTVSAGYTGSADAGGNEGTNGALALVSFNMPVCKNFSFAPEASFGMRQVKRYSKWLGELSFRALASYSVPISKMRLGVFTGPRMDVKVFDNTTDDLDGVGSSNYRTLNASWMFGLLVNFGNIDLKASYSLPFTYYQKGTGIIVNDGKFLSVTQRIHIFEVSIGYRFKVGK